jgi:hypothetical protein
MKKLNEKQRLKAAQKGNYMAKLKNKDKNWLQRLVRVADAARARVSTYSDDRRSELEKFARGIIQEVKAEAKAESAKAAQVYRR